MKEKKSRYFVENDWGQGKKIMKKLKQISFVDRRGNGGKRKRKGKNKKKKQERERRVFCFIDLSEVCDASMCFFRYVVLWHTLVFLVFWSLYGREKSLFSISSLPSFCLGRCVEFAFVSFPS